MKNSCYRFSLDIQKAQSQISIPLRNKESGRELRISLTDGGEPFELYGLDSKGWAVLVAKKDGTSNIASVCAIDIINNEIICEVDPDMIDEIGVMECEIRLYDFITGKVLYAPRFEFLIDERVIHGDTVYTGATDIIDKLVETNSKVITAEEERKINEEQRHKIWNTVLDSPKVWELDDGCLCKASGFVSLTKGLGDFLGEGFAVKDKSLLYVADEGDKKRFILHLAHYELPYEFIIGATDGETAEWYGVAGKDFKTLNGEYLTESGDIFLDGIIPTIGSVIRLEKSDFANGTFSAGTGIEASDYWIITPTSVKVNIGDKITIKPSDGAKVWWRIFDSDNLSVASNLINGGVITEETEYISEYEGYFNVQVAYVDGTTISPDDYGCSIIVDGSRISSLEKEVKDLKENILVEVDPSQEHTNEQVYGALAMDEVLLVLDDSLQSKQDELVSGENIKTINGESILGAGDITIECGSSAVTSLAINPKQKPFTQIINDCQNADDWTVTNTSTDISSIDTTDYIIGIQSLRSDNQMRCIKNQYDLLNNDLVIKFKINSVETGAKLLLSVGNVATPSLRVVYELARGCAWTTPSGWQEIAIPYTGYSYGSFDDVDFSAINDLVFMSSQGAVDWNLQYVGVRPKSLSKGIISFTFDDGWSSQYTGVKLLAEKGITSTIFCIKDAVESGNYLTLDNLKSLVNLYGTDIEVHGDPAYDQWTEEDMKAHWSESQQFLKENGLGEGKHLAYPNGIFPENVVQLAKGYFDSCRTIIPFVPLETYPLDDRYRVRAVSGVGASGVTVDTVKKYIDRAMASGAWLILVFHKIGDTTGDSMYCSESDLKAIADYAVDSGAYIMNYAEVMDSSVVG